MIALTILLFVTVFAVATFSVKINSRHEAVLSKHYDMIRELTLARNESIVRLSMLNDKLEYHITQEEEGKANRASLLGELDKRCVDTMAKKSNIEL